VKLESDPFKRFREVYGRAVATGMRDPNGMCLATVDVHGRPSTRMVLLKDYGFRGFVFYTNLESPKAVDLRTNPNVSLTFYWRELEQQIHVRGLAEPVSDAEADVYFATRPRGSQLGAWASHQSRPLSSRAVLLAAVARLEARHLGRAVPRPPFWSGYRVVPREFEFWVAGPFRLHERTRYARSGEQWETTQLSP
jgi:pyridoxamine 5'-phosphate oxidase